MPNVPGSKEWSKMRLVTMFVNVRMVLVEQTVKSVLKFQIKLLKILESE